jgi:VanZ family protein
MKLILKSNISAVFISYLILLILLNILPINSNDSSLNNNYFVKIRWDYLGHFLAYSFLGVVGFLYAKLKSFNILLFFFFILSFSVGAEYLQMFISWRSFNINDLLANLLGVMIGFFGTVVFLNYNRKYNLI